MSKYNPKAAFIIPYFGNFKNYFQLFLNSCGKSKYIDFLLFTDNENKYDYPDNVKVIKMTLSEFNQQFNEALDVNIVLTRAYKLCDFRPMYEKVFHNYIEQYDYWGYCDTDLIWGDLDKLLYPLLEKGYDKLFFFGHCTLIKNTEENNNLYLKPIAGKHIGLDVIHSPKNHSFDEEFNNSINSIFIQENKNVFFNEMQANVYTKSSNFFLTKYNFDKKSYEIEKLKNVLYVYDNGSVFQYCQDGKKIVKNEFLYIHLQSRNMEINIDLNTNKYKIIPNSFDNIEVDDITLDNFSHIRKKYYNLHYFRLRSYNLWVKIKRKFGADI